VDTFPSLNPETKFHANPGTTLLGQTIHPA
jgi:hypothetical protein